MNYISGRARPAGASAAADAAVDGAVVVAAGGRAAGRGGGDEGEGEGGGGLTIQGLPLVKPPWGRITAIDLNKGEIVWQIAHGETPDNVRNNPALKGLDIPRTGRPGRMGPLVTKTLVICGRRRILHHAVGRARRHAAGVRQSDG